MTNQEMVDLLRLPATELVVSRENFCVITCLLIFEFVQKHSTQPVNMFPFVGQ